PPVAATEASEPATADRPDAAAPAVEPAPGRSDATPSSEHDVPVRVREREPAGGIPVTEWVQALTAAAIETFGDRWEQRLAEMLAVLRRRVTGDFEVDEYGFDVEITEKFLLAALRPLKEKWFRIELRGVENIPAEGGALL